MGLYCQPTAVDKEAFHGMQRFLSKDGYIHISDCIL